MNAIANPFEELTPLEERLSLAARKVIMQASRPFERARHVGFFVPESAMADLITAFVASTKAVLPRIRRGP